jgi:hypothetical protein
MSTLLAIALAAAATVQPSCSWDNPGANPYTGNSDAAIDRYTDIPDSTRVKLKRRVSYGNPDEMVVITRDAITGRHHYDPKISDMHFGKASVCSTVTRGKWSEKREEPAAVYCADKHCILVPKICGNVSRITRDPVVAAAPPPELPRRVWEVPAHELGLIDTPPAFDVFTMAEPVVIAPIVPPARPLASAPVPIPPRDDWNPRPRPSTVLPPPAGGGGPNPLLPSPVAPVPEPETYAMLLGGLALMGVMARRKHRKAAAAAAAAS